MDGRLSDTILIILIYKWYILTQLGQLDFHTAVAAAAAAAAGLPQKLALPEGI